MWLIILFDLPVETAEERRAYTFFRKKLKQLGFALFQKSVYIRWEQSEAAANVTARTLLAFCPRKGDVSLLRMSNRSMQHAECFRDAMKSSIPQPTADFLVI